VSEYFDLLSYLQKTGMHNSYEFPEILMAHFDLTKQEARDVFKAWCRAITEGELV